MGLNSEVELDYEAVHGMRASDWADDLVRQKEWDYDRFKREGQISRDIEGYLIRESIASVPDYRSTVQLWEWTDTQEDVCASGSN